MHPAAILLYPLYLVVHVFFRYAVAAWGVLILAMTLVACAPSWSPEAATLPAEWLLALPICGLLFSLPLTIGFWRWHYRASQREPGPVGYAEEAFDRMPDFIVTLGIVFVLALGMLLMGRLHIA